MSNYISRSYLLKNSVILTVLTIVSFILRLIVSNKEVLYPDSCLYLSFAKAILKGKFSFDFSSGSETILPPLYPILSAFGAFLTGHIEVSALLISAIAGAFLIIPVFYLAKSLYNETAAWISVVLVILAPALIHWSSSMLTESLFITLFISSIAAGLYAVEKGKKLCFFLAGALLGLSYVTRVIGLSGVPVIGVWTVFYAVKHSYGLGVFNLQKITKEFFTVATIFCIGIILVTGLYLIKLHSFYGYWTIAGGYGSIKGTISYQGASTKAGWEDIKTNNVEEGFYSMLIKKISINLKNYSSALFKIVKVTVVFIIIGIFFRRWKILYVISFILIYFSALLVQPMSPMLDERVRYLSPILPLFLVIASGGITRIQDLIKWRIIRQAIIPLTLAIVLLSFTSQLKILPLQFGTLFSNKIHMGQREKIGLWMKENLPHPIKVMSRKPYVPYYADGVWFSTPATYNDVMNLSRENAVDYIVVDRAIEYYLRPELRFLFYPEQVPEGLQFIGGIRHPKTGELYIGLYKINRSSK